MSWFILDFLKWSWCLLLFLLYSMLLAVATNAILTILISTEKLCWRKSNLCVYLASVPICFSIFSAFLRANVTTFVYIEAKSAFRRITLSAMLWASSLIPAFGLANRRFKCFVSSALLFFGSCFNIAVSVDSYTWSIIYTYIFVRHI